MQTATNTPAALILTKDSYTGNTTTKTNTVKAAACYASKLAEGKAEKLTGRQKALATFKMTVEGRPATFADLSAFQINEAIDAVGFTVKGSQRQQSIGFIQDLTGDALLDILEGKYNWDSAKGSFYLCLKMRVKQLLQKGVAKTSYQREAQSYSGVQDSTGEEMEFSYPSADLSPLATLEAKESEANILARFSTKEQQYISLVKQDIEGEKIAEIMQFPTYGAFRVWVSKFKAKHGLNEAIDAQISKSGLRKRANK